jgi:hypothetical protein
MSLTTQGHYCQKKVLFFLNYKNIEWKIITGKLNHWALPLSTKNPVSVKPYPTSSHISFSNRLDI